MSSGRPPIEDLEARIGHLFSDKTLVRDALTHVSALGVGRRAQTYERLEFLGDRVLDADLRANQGCECQIFAYVYLTKTTAL